MIIELNQLNEQLKTRISYIASLFHQYDEDTDYEMLPSSNYFELGDITECQLLDVSGNMAKISLTFYEPFQARTKSEIVIPIDAIESWTDQQLINWFLQEEDRLFNEDIKREFRHLLASLKHTPDMLKDLVGVTDEQEQLDIIKAHTS